MPKKTEEKNTKGTKKATKASVTTKNKKVVKNTQPNPLVSISTYRL